MNFYHSTHRHYCGIDLHARTLYVCIIDPQGKVLLHKEIKAQPERLLAYVYPKEMRATRDLLRRRTRIVQHGAMLKAHVVNTTSQYNLPPNKVNLKNVNAREQVRLAFANKDVLQNINFDLAIIECYHRELDKLEDHLERQASHATG
jgi:hypothetical protein